MSYFSDAPPSDRLDGVQVEVLREVRKMLEALRPIQVVPESTGARYHPKAKELAIEIPHRDRPDDSLVITVSERDIAVSYAFNHTHFFPGKDPEWMEEALLFIWDLLRGRIELEIRFWGRVPVKTRVFRVDDGGGRQLVETSGTLSFNLFAKKRMQRHVPSFVS